MRINILPKDFAESGRVVAIIGENYRSCLWNECYNNVGSFTLELSKEYYKKIDVDMYVQRADRKNLMVIKSLQIENESLIISGKQATQVLDDVAFVGTINENVNIDTALYNAYNNTRKYPFVDVVKNPKIADKYAHQISNKSMLELYTNMCEENNIGFRAFLQNNNRLGIELYKPDNTPAVFSEFAGNAKLENILKSIEGYKNYAIVLGEGEGAKRVRVDVDLSTGGEQLRELIVDARNTRKEEEDTDATYKEKLKSEGAEKLLEKTKAFTIELSNSAQGFGTRYDLGSRVKIFLPEYGLTYETRITSFSEKSQHNNSEISVTFGELLKTTR